MTSEALPVAPQRTPRRRWWQFSLRTLLLVMVPVACGFAWLGAEYRAGRRQHEAIAWVEQQGGSIEYDDAATQANWRRQWLGEWFPESVRSVNLRFTKTRDLSPLAGLATLRNLDISNTQVSDLSPLAGLVNLQELNLDFTQVSDLSPLAGLVNLQELEYVQTDVTDLAPLARLESLRYLKLYEMQFDYEQLRTLREELPHCNFDIGE